MKTLLLTILLCFCFTNIGFCDVWYIIDINNNIIGKLQYEPDSEDLKARQETAIRSKENLKLDEAEFRGNKIVKHVETQQEKDDKKDKQDRFSELDLIKNKAFKNACLELETTGTNFKKVKCSDFDSQ